MVFGEIGIWESDYGNLPSPRAGGAGTGGGEPEAILTGNDCERGMEWM